ncbi:MAG: hypothetical protein WCB56_18400 [Terriglobales bacterium]|jgi:hypothetical protein
MAMRRWLCIAALGLSLVAMPVWGQRHGGGGGGHAASGGSFSSHSAFHSSGVSSAGVHSPGIHSSGVRGYGAVRGGVAGRGAGINLRIGNSFYPRRGVYGRRSHSSYAPYYPYGYYGWYADPLYDTSDQDTYADEYRPAPAQDEDSGVRQDLDALNGKVDRLQQDVEARNRPKDTEPETALVFRDRHVEEVRNYAISNGTLWVLNAPAAKKIPLDQLDLAATVKMNDDRGVDFQVPGPSLSIMLMR